MANTCNHSNISAPFARTSRRKLLMLAAAAGIAGGGRRSTSVHAQDDPVNWPGSFADVLAGCANALQADVQGGFRYSADPLLAFSLDAAISRELVIESNRQNLEGAQWLYRVDLIAAGEGTETRNLTMAGFEDPARAQAALATYGGATFTDDAVVESGNVMPEDAYADIFGFEIELPERGPSNLLNARFTAGSTLVFFNEVSPADPATEIDLTEFLSRVQGMPTAFTDYGAAFGMDEQEIAAQWSDEDRQLWPLMASPMRFEGAPSMFSAYLRWQGIDQAFAHEQTEEDTEHAREERFGDAVSGLNGYANVTGMVDMGYLHNTAIFATQDDAAAFDARLDEPPADDEEHHTHATVVPDDAPASGTSGSYSMSVAEDQAFAGYDLRVLRGPYLIRFSFSDFSGVDPAGTIDPLAPEWLRLKTGCIEIAEALVNAPPGEALVLPVPVAWQEG